jgi:hypothetical protein
MLQRPRLARRAGPSAHYKLRPIPRYAEDGRTLQPFSLIADFPRTDVSVAIANRKSKIENLLAGVVQW